MNLTNEQLQAIESGCPVGILIDETECVVVRKDVYEQSRQLTDDDWTVDQLRMIAGQTVLDADAAGPIQ